MTDYSRMSYEQLRKIADDDVMAEKMSEEEYEALSVQLWRKFGIENGIRAQQNSFAPTPARANFLRSIVNRFRSNPTVEPQVSGENARIASPEVRGLFRSGD